MAIVYLKNWLLCKHYIEYYLKTFFRAFKISICGQIINIIKTIFYVHTLIDNEHVHPLCTKEIECTWDIIRCLYIEEVQVYRHRVYSMIIRNVLERPVQYRGVYYSFCRSFLSPLSPFMHWYIYNTRTRTRAWLQTNERLFLCNLKEILYEITHFNSLSNLIMKYECELLVVTLLLINTGYYS